MYLNMYLFMCNLCRYSCEYFSLEFNDYLPSTVVKSFWPTQGLLDLYALHVINTKDKHIIMNSIISTYKDKYELRSTLLVITLRSLRSEDCWFVSPRRISLESKPNKSQFLLIKTIMNNDSKISVLISQFLHQETHLLQFLLQWHAGTRVCVVTRYIRGGPGLEPITILNTASGLRGDVQTWSSSMVIKM